MRRQKKRIKKHVAGIDFDMLGSDPGLVSYRAGGEYQALLWLKAYVEERASVEPKQLVDSMLSAIVSGVDDPVFYALYAATILRFV